MNVAGFGGEESLIILGDLNVEAGLQSRMVYCLTPTLTLTPLITRYLTPTPTSTSSIPRILTPTPNSDSDST